MPVNNTPTPEQLYILLARAERDGLHATVIERLKIILHFAEHQYSISETCRQFNISRSTFHRWMERFNPEDLSTLADKSHEPMNLRQSAIDPESIELIRRYRMRYPQMGKQRIAEILFRDHATDVSTSSVGRIIERECLYFADTPLHWKKRVENQTSPPVPLSVSGDGVTLATVESLISVSPLSAHGEGLGVRSAGRGEVSWKTIKHFVVVSSVITNIVFVSILVGMALFEKSTDVPPTQNPNIDYQQQEVLHAAPNIPQVFFP